MKIQKVLPTITPFAGFSFINDLFNQSGLSLLIDNELGYGVSTKEYPYSDIISNYNHIFYCGGDCAEDIRQHLRPTLEAIPDNKVCRADTLLRGISELVTENEEFVSKQGKSYNFNINEKLNNLNIPPKITRIGKVRY